MKKKKVITTLICLALSLGIIGCNSGKNNSESVNNEKNTEINTEFTTELLGQKEDTTKYPIEVTKQYTNTEMQMFEGFIRGVSQASLVAGDENSERTSENLPDYRKELIYYYMMVFNDFKGLDSFEEEGLLKEISQRDDEITELVRNGYQLSAEQFCMGEEYIWKNGLKDKQEAIDFFENLIYEYDWLSKNPDGSYNLFECLEPGVPEIETISIWKTSKNTFSIEGQTKHIYDTDISDTYYIQVEAEVNEESPFGGMTVTKLTVSETPIQTDKQEIGQNLEWTQAYKDFLSNKENFVPLLLQDVDCDVSGYMEGFALQDIDEDAVPELLLCKMGKVPYVYIYSYSNGNVTHIGGTTCDPYNQAEHRKSFGFDEETGKAYIYTEGAFDMAVIYLQDMSNVTDEKLMEEYNDWYGEAPIEFEYERDLNYWNEHRKEIWANSTYDTFGDSKEEALEILHNFVPLKWHKITESEMASYICEDYYNINLEGEQEIGKSVFFEIDGSYDYEAILKNGNSNKLRCYEIENEYCNLVCYVDLETLSCVRVDGNLKKDSVIEIVIVDAPDGYVNLRYGSSTEYDIITEIQNGVQLDVYRMDDTGKWCGIWYKDNWGWIARSQVSTHEEVVMEYATNKVFTEAEIQEIKDRLEVPKELETTFAKGNVYYKESFGCAMIDVEIYHNGERIASAQIMDDGTEDGVGEFYRYSLYGKGSPFIP